MLKWPLNFLRQPISIFKKTMEQMTAVATNVTVEKRPEETLIDGVRSEESSNKKQKTEVGEARSIKRKYALLSKSQKSSTERSKMKSLRV